jgi:hypothetical protein
MKLFNIIGGILCNIISPTILVLIYLILILPYATTSGDAFAAVLGGLIGWLVLFVVFLFYWGEIIFNYMREN